PLDGQSRLRRPPLRGGLPLRLRGNPQRLAPRRPRGGAPGPFSANFGDSAENPLIRETISVMLWRTWGTRGRRGGRSRVFFCADQGRSVPPRSRRKAPAPPSPPPPPPPPGHDARSRPAATSVLP